MAVAVKNRLALAVLGALSTMAVAEPIGLSLGASSEFSSNPAKIAGGQSGREDRLTLAVSWSETVGRNQFALDYSASDVASSGAAPEGSFSLQGSASAVLPINARMQFTARHSAEQITADVTLPNSSGNETQTQALDVGLNWEPLAPGRASLRIESLFGFSSVTEGSGEDVNSTRLNVIYDYGIDPLTVVSPFIRLTNTYPELSEDVEYRGGGVRATRSLRSLVYSAEIGMGETSSPSGVSNDDTEYAISVRYDRAFAVGLDLARTIQTSRQSNIDRALAAQLGLEEFGVSQSTTDTLGLGFEYRQLCGRCLVSVDLDRVEQDFTQTSINDQSSDLASISLNYLLSTRSSIALALQQETTEFDAAPASNFEQDSGSLSWNRAITPSLSINAGLGYENRTQQNSSDSYDEWNASLAVSKTL